MKITKKLLAAEQFLGRLFIFLLTLAALFMLCEYGARRLIADGKVQVHLDFKNSPRPYVMYGNKLNFGEVNSLGYLGALPKMPKKKKEYRVFILGGSTLVYGRPPLPDLIQHKFNDKKMEDVRIYNFGVASSNVHQDLVRLLMDVSRFSPDMVLMYGGGNELLHPDPRPGYPHGQLLIENNPLWKREVKDYPTFYLLAFGSHLLRYLFAKNFADIFLQEGKLKAENGFRTPEWKSKVEDLYLWALGQAALLCQAQGIKFFAVFQPMSYFKKDLSPSEQIFTQDRSYYLEMREHIWQKYKKIQGQFELLNFNEVFAQDHEQIFYDSIHVLDKGNELLAEKLFLEISRRLSR